MSARGIVIDDATGQILRTISGDPAMFAIQVGAGQSIFAITGDGWTHLDDAHIVVSGEGTLVLTGTAPAGTTAPTYELQYVAI